MNARGQWNPRRIQRPLVNLAIFAVFLAGPVIQTGFGQWAYQSATIQWDTLTIVNDPSLTIEWTSIVEPAKRTVVGGNMLPFEDGTFIEVADWATLTSGQTIGAATTSRVANDAVLQVSNSIAEPATVSLYSTAFRTGAFVAHGEGTLTISVGFSHAYNVPSLAPFTFGYVTEQLNLGEFGGPTNYDERVVSFSSLGPQAENGTLSVNYHFLDGQNGRFAVAAAAEISTVPEPSTLIFLSMASFPLAFLGTWRKR